MTRHNGRSGMHGTYNPKHNDRSFDVNNSEHIDKERARRNVYWDCFQGIRYPTDQEQEDRIIYSFEEIECAFYSNRYFDYCLAQHERNKRTGHSDRDRLPQHLYQDKKTCPEESLTQIGTREQSVSPEVLTNVAIEFFKEFHRRFGKYVHILDWSLHLDESTPHIHERHVFDCENHYGEIAPQQEKALELLGFELPDPEQKPGKLNNRKMSFDAACRAMLFDICERNGLHPDREPEYGGRKYLETQDYILMKQKEKIAVQDQIIESKKADLKEITVRIENTEAFVDAVADTAYEKAVEAVTDEVMKETRKEDLEIIDIQKRMVINDPDLTKGARQFAKTLFRDLADRFSKMSQHVSEKLSQIFKTYEKRESLKQPIRDYVRERLKRYSDWRYTIEEPRGSKERMRSNKQQDMSIE